LGPINVVKQRFRKLVGVVSPHGTTAMELKKIATFNKPIKEAALEASQMPDDVTVGAHVIHKPDKWKRYQATLTPSRQSQLMRKSGKSS